MAAFYIFLINFFLIQATNNFVFQYKTINGNIQWKHINFQYFFGNHFRFIITLFHSFLPSHSRKTPFVTSEEPQFVFFEAFVGYFFFLFRLCYHRMVLFHTESQCFLDNTRRILFVTNESNDICFSVLFTSCHMSIYNQWSYQWSYLIPSTTTNFLLYTNIKRIFKFYVNHRKQLAIKSKKDSRIYKWHTAIFFYPKAHIVLFVSILMALYLPIVFLPLWEEDILQVSVKNSNLAPFEYFCIVLISIFLAFYLLMCCLIRLDIYLFV